jgi:hypothetical protein
MLLTIATNYAQSSASQSGIAVQGIARDNNNTALADATITFKFTLYYNDPGPIDVFIENTALTTDAFGVFSYILDVDPSTNANFSNNSIFLKIEDVTSGTIISDEVFKHVPYAIVANNGVPTGSIMPYIGGNAPEGWVLCNGQNLQTISGSANLRVLLNSTNAPNLQGMFLRGTGGSGDHVGPNLNEIQPDTAGPHTHPDNIVIKGVETVNSFTAKNSLRRSFINGTSNSEAVILYGDHNNNIKENTVTGSVTVPEHATKKQGGVQENTKVSETRPVNYGVTYIIKL